MYEQYRNIQIEMDDETLAFIGLRDASLGEPDEDGNTPGDTIDILAAAQMLEDMASTAEEGTAARMRERATWLRGLV